MKPILLTFAVIALTVFSSNAQQYRKYPFKSGKIEYALEGSVKGTEILYWDDYGYKEVSIENSESKMFGQTSVTKSTTVTIGTEIYEWSDEDNNVYKTSNPIAETWEEGNYDEDDVEDFSIKLITDLGFEKIGTESILGKSCDVYKGIGKVWVWKGLSLKTEVKFLGTNSVIVAKSVDTNIRVSSSLFKIPEDREVIENGNIDEHVNEEMENNSEEVPINPDDIKKALNSLFGGN